MSRDDVAKARSEAGVSVTKLNNSESGDSMTSGIVLGQMTPELEKKAEASSMKALESGLGSGSYKRMPQRAISDKDLDSVIAGSAPKARKAAAPAAKRPSRSRSRSAAKAQGALEAAAQCADSGSAAPPTPGVSLCLKKRLAPSAIPQFPMFEPQRSDTGGYLLKVREVRTMLGDWSRGTLVPRDTQVLVRTGVVYDAEMLSQGYVLRPLASHVCDNEVSIANVAVDVRGELCVALTCSGKPPMLKQGDDCAELALLG